MAKDPAEDHRIHERARAGDVGARDLLAVRHMGLVRVIAREYAGRLGRDDAFGVGCLALATAIARYDPASHKGVPFGGYAGGMIRRALALACRKQGPPPAEGPEPESRAESPPEAAIRDEESDALRRAFVALSPVEAEVVSALLGLDGPAVSVTYLARRLRCPPATIMEVRAAACLALARALRRDIAR